MKFVLDLCRWSERLTETMVTQASKDAGDVGGMKPVTCWKADEATV